VCAGLDTLAEPAILVGHSSGGMVISAAAELRPHAVRALVYLAAFLLPPGVTPPAVMRDDTEAILRSSLVVDEVHRTLSVRDEALKDVFYGDCSDEDVAWARVRLVPEPPRAPVTTPAAPTLEPPAPIAEFPPRFYVETLHDRALGPATQRKMYLTLPCRKVYSLPASHSPFLSAPRELADCLLDVDGSLGSMAPPNG
jgi:pimeloyl-ACP methyl ester carboxylesterase